MVNTPIPMSLKSEAKKAARILHDFTMPDSHTGFDRIIPADLIMNAKGLAILTVFKLGFLVTARGGSGIVIAKLSHGAWSGPSAIGIAGIGGGLEVGAEVTDFVIVLNSNAAVQAFSKGGNLTIGGNLSVAVGPMGRNMEGDIALRSTAAMYTYSRTKGLFVGISIEGSGIIERKAANRKFYGVEVRACQILDGKIDQPKVCQVLYDTLHRHEELAECILKRKVSKLAHKAAESSVITKDFNAVRSSCQSRDDSSKVSWDSRGSKSLTDGCYKPPISRRSSSRQSMQLEKVNRKSRSSAIRHSQSMKFPSPTSHLTSGPTPSFRKISAPPDSFSSYSKPGKIQVKALWSYRARMACDLCFIVGDVITVYTKTSSRNDWWEGCLHGKIGLFPANYTGDTVLDF